MNEETNVTADPKAALVGWVMEKVNAWKDHYVANFDQRHQEYYRLWRGQHEEEDKSREGERSRIISPALQQAVESNVAEIEEATFGKGKFFNMRDDRNDPDASDIKALRDQLSDDFAFARVKPAISEVVLNGAVFGTGIAELVLCEEEEVAPASRPTMGGMQEYGVTKRIRTTIKTIPTLPQNFRIDPNATCIQDALGCATDRMVGEHQVRALQEAGVYDASVEIGQASTEYLLQADRSITEDADDRVRLIKYYGLVPRHLLEPAIDEPLAEDEELVDLTAEVEVEDDGYYVEAIVVIGNEQLLKASENNFMMGQRPVVAFAWDTVPSQFWGRGVCEKGYNSQKALDAELRARIDALALTIHPMMGLDATRIPRGHKPKVGPGRNILTVGNPREVLSPLNFGSVDQITFAQAGELQKMVQQATGAVDAAGMPTAAARGDGTAAGISMSLGAVLKRHRRTLMNFQENFLIPLVEQHAWLYMQFDPERYPAKDYKFEVVGSLGMIAREYEVGQLVQLMQTLGQDSPAHGVLMNEVIRQMSLSNSEEVIETLVQANQPNPEAQKAAQEKMQREMEFLAAQTDNMKSQSEENRARGLKYTTEARLMPEELLTKRIAAAATNMDPGNEDDVEFEKRMGIMEKVMDRIERDRELSVKEQDAETRRLSTMNRGGTAAPQPAEPPAQSLQALLGGVQ